MRWVSPWRALKRALLGAKLTHQDVLVVARGPEVGAPTHAVLAASLVLQQDIGVSAAYGNSHEDELWISAKLHKVGHLPGPEGNSNAAVATALHAHVEQMPTALMTSAVRHAVAAAVRRPRAKRRAVKELTAIRRPPTARGLLTAAAASRQVPCPGAGAASREVRAPEAEPGSHWYLQRLGPATAIGVMPRSLAALFRGLPCGELTVGAVAVCTWVSAPTSQSFIASEPLVAAVTTTAHVAALAAKTSQGRDLTFEGRTARSSSVDLVHLSGAASPQTSIEMFELGATDHRVELDPLSIATWPCQLIAMPSNVAIEHRELAPINGAVGQLRWRVPPLATKMHRPLHPEGELVEDRHCSRQLQAYFVTQHEGVLSAIAHGERFLGRLAEDRSRFERDLGVLAKLNETSPTTHGLRDLLWRCAPAAMALLLANGALHLSDHPAFWEPIHDATGLFPVREQAIWGKRFLLFCTLHRLPLAGGIEEGGLHYVSPIIHQSGLPTTSLPALFSALEAALEGGHVGAGLVLGTWPSAIAGRLGHGVRGFVESRPAEARLWLECLESLMRAWMRGASPSSHDGLPTRLREAFTTWCEQRELDAPRTTRRRAPALALSPTLGPVIRFPELDRQTKAVITILADSDDEPSRLTVPVSTRGGHAFTPQRDFPISPDKSFLVELAAEPDGVPELWEVAGLADAAHPPCLVFLNELARPHGATLPTTEVDLVYPTSCTIEIRDRNGDVLPSAVEPLPMHGKWESYSVLELDLCDAATLTLRGQGSGGQGTARTWDVGDGTRLAAMGARPQRRGPPGPDLYATMPEGIHVEAPAHVVPRLRVQQHGSQGWETIMRGRPDAHGVLSLKEIDRARRLGAFRVDAGGREFLRFDVVPELGWKWSWRKLSFFLEHRNDVQGRYRGEVISTREGFHPAEEDLETGCELAFVVGAGLADVTVLLRPPRWAVMDRGRAASSQNWHLSGPTLSVRDLLQMREPVIWLEAGDARIDDAICSIVWPGIEPLQLRPSRSARSKPWEIAIFPQKDGLRYNAHLDANVELEVEGVKTTLVFVAREWQCTHCPEAFGSPADAARHVEVHRDSALQSLRFEIDDYKTYVAAARTEGEGPNALPDEIHQCPYCDDYFPLGGIESRTTRIEKHQAKDCPEKTKKKDTSASLGTVVIAIHLENDVRKIRDAVYKGNLPRRYECRRCRRSLGSDRVPLTPQQLAEHEACFLEELFR